MKNLIQKIALGLSLVGVGAGIGSVATSKRVYPIAYQTAMNDAEKQIDECTRENKDYGWRTDPLEVPCLSGTLRRRDTKIWHEAVKELSDRYLGRAQYYFNRIEKEINISAPELSKERSTELNNQISKFREDVLKTEKFDATRDLWKGIAFYHESIELDLTSR